MDKLYIPGDLVKYLSQVVKIVEVYQDGTCYFENETMCGQQDYKDAELIPLTPEILEKNGWYGATHSKQSDDSTKILYKTFKRKGYPTIKVSQDLKITCELSPFIVKLESVSDLQHLLFGLGINHEMEV